MKKTYRMKLLAVLIAAVTLLTTFTGCATGDTMTTEIFDLTSKETAQWTVGFGQAVLPYPETSDNPIYIAGYNQGWDVSGILDEQRASAVWLDCGGEGILIIGIIANGLNLLGVAQGPQKMVKGAIIVVAVIIDVIRRKSSESAK